MDAAQMVFSLVADEKVAAAFSLKAIVDFQVCDALPVRDLSAALPYLRSGGALVNKSGAMEPWR